MTSSTRQSSPRRWIIRHVGMPLAVLGVSILLGGAANMLVEPAIKQLRQGDMTGRMLAVEVIPPAAQATPALVAQVMPEPQSQATNTLLTTSLEPVSTTAAMEAPGLEQAPAANKQARSDDAGPYRYFNGRRIRPARTLTMVTTAYSPDERSCGPDANGTTASGKSVWTNGMKMVAADTRLLPFGTLVSIPGYYDGQPVPVLDRGGAIKGHRLDLLYPTHERAMLWGKKRQTITIWEYVD